MRKARYRNFWFRRMGQTRLLSEGVAQAEAPGVERREEDRYRDDLVAVAHAAEARGEVGRAREARAHVGVGVARPGGAVWADVVAAVARARVVEEHLGPRPAPDQLPHTHAGGLAPEDEVPRQEDLARRARRRRIWLVLGLVPLTRPRPPPPTPDPQETTQARRRGSRSARLFKVVGTVALAALTGRGARESDGDGLHPSGRAGLRRPVAARLERAAGAAPHAPVVVARAVEVLGGPHRLRVELLPQVAAVAGRAVVRVARLHDLRLEIAQVAVRHPLPVLEGAKFHPGECSVQPLRLYALWLCGFMAMTARNGIVVPELEVRRVGRPGEAERAVVAVVDEVEVAGAAATVAAQRVGALAPLVRAPDGEAHHAALAGAARPLPLEPHGRRRLPLLLLRALRRALPPLPPGPLAPHSLDSSAPRSPSPPTRSDNLSPYANPYSRIARFSRAYTATTTTCSSGAAPS
ncbi:hypothetical protein FIBSPDRAFT_901466 [Athelia psychrophila]|uniref:Uncharacterized protein n=1 Tax=Athelia psychrophila TaxID=1759441 RepID=A0A165X5B8_9AGAM|nr:hypothetical protein FIBSPDRAFT_901466 [Fibularhizoctonia sp. CBS 109695]